jgi:carboxyl-terminal processing protease
MEQEKNKRYEIWQPLLMALVLAGGMLVGTRIDDELPMISRSGAREMDQPWQELKSVVNFIESRYGDSLNIDSITEEAIRLLVSKLDPHSYYLSGEEYIGFKERMEGSYIGIGIDYDIIRDTIQLIRIVPDSPAEKAGLQPGDQILAIDEIQTTSKGLTHATAYQIWKKANQDIQLKVRTVNEHKVVVKTITKGPVQLYSVPTAIMIQKNIGYIKINRFASDTYREFMQKLEKLHDEGLTKLIIDVRQNPGGSLDQVVKILNQLIPERDQLLLFTEGLHAKRVEYKSTGNVFFPIDDIAVLIDEHSVSASEVLAGVLQDLGRATIVGRRSYGKGLVQEMYDLSPTSAINLTVAKYFLPSGRLIQKSYTDRTAYDTELDLRRENGELFYEDSLKITNVKTVKALDGKIRPYGEGIVPDVFVAADSFYYGNLWKKLEKPFYQDAFQYYLANQMKIGEALKTDPSLAAIRSEISNRKVFSDLAPYLVEEIKDKALDGFIHLIKWHYYGEQSFIENNLNEDQEIQAAIEVLRGD